MHSVTKYLFNSYYFMHMLSADNIIVGMKDPFLAVSIIRAKQGRGTLIILLLMYA